MFVDERKNCMSAGDAAETATESDDADLGGRSNVLVLAPALDGGVRESYFETLLPGQPSELSVLGVDYRRTPEEWASDWQRHVAERPRRCSVVSIDEMAGSNRPGEQLVDGPDSKVIPDVENPADLTGLGITVSEYLSAHSDERPFVVFDSLTVLLQYVDVEEAFRFLHVLTTRVRTAGAVAHYHVDPAAHDEQTLVTLKSLFGAVAAYDSDAAAWSVERR
jgi:hypothetical protein